MHERLLWRARPSQWRNTGFFLVIVIACAIVLAAGWWCTTIGYHQAWKVSVALDVILFIPVLSVWISTYCTKYELTTQRLRITRGVLSSKTNDMELYRVRDYSVQQPFFLRLVGRGRVVLLTADDSSPRVVLDAVSRSQKLVDVIRNAVEDCRSKKGVREVSVDR